MRCMLVGSGACKGLTRETLRVTLAVPVAAKEHSTDETPAMTSTTSLVRISPLFVWAVAVGLTLGVAGAPRMLAQQTAGETAPANGTQVGAVPAPAPQQGAAPTPKAAAKDKKSKEAYTGPTKVVVLPATPML